jgi:hypothetical protein
MDAKADHRLWLSLLSHLPHRYAIQKTPAAQA